MVRIKVGDIFEINTRKGKAYLHYINKESTTGELIRVLPGLYSDRPANFNELAALKEKYMVSFPLSAAYKKGIIELVSSCSTLSFSKPKFMRTEHNIRGEFLGWHIVNTDNWQRQLIKSLTTEQKKLSPWGIWNDTLLIERLENDWSLEKWC